jgi:hypothetical protein
MSKVYGINLGFIPLEKEQYNEIKAVFLEECSKQELFDAIDDTEFILEKFDTLELLNAILDVEDGAWIIEHLSDRNLENAQDEFIRNTEKLTPKQVKNLIEEISYMSYFKVLPCDNILDLSKAEFIVENWDKIKIENINL